MARYIDADLMIADIQRYLCANCSIHCNPTNFKNSACEIAECLRMIDDTPTADVQEVRHGRWVKDVSQYDKRDNWYHCSCCNRSINIICGDKLENHPYCHCGVRMDGDNNG